jgi:hypothetical protein
MIYAADFIEDLMCGWLTEWLIEIVWLNYWLKGQLTNLIEGVNGWLHDRLPHWLIEGVAGDWLREEPVANYTHLLLASAA